MGVKKCMQATRLTLLACNQSSDAEGGVRAPQQRLDDAVAKPGLKTATQVLAARNIRLNRLRGTWASVLRRGLPDKGERSR